MTKETTRKEKIQYGIQPKRKETDGKAELFDRLFGRLVAEMIAAGIPKRVGMDKERFLRTVLPVLGSFTLEKKVKALNNGQAATVAVIIAIRNVDYIGIRQKKKLQAELAFFLDQKEGHIGAP